VAYLFTPPQRTETVLMAGSLSYSYSISETVWKDGDGVWHHLETPTTEVLDAAALHYSTPAIVPNDVAAELITAGIGACIPIEA
jgi:hypothetical protein